MSRSQTDSFLTIASEIPNLPRLAATVSLALLAIAPFASPLVDTDFEPSINSVGNLHNQASTGPNPWTSNFGNVTNTGPTEGLQCAGYSNNMNPGQYHEHSYVDLGAVIIPTGWKLRATVDVYLDPGESMLLTGLAAWSNGHTRELGLGGGRGDGSFYGRDGVNASWSMLGNTSNPPRGGWYNIGLEIEQVSPNTLRTTYLDNGTTFLWNGLQMNTHNDTFGVSNLVSDITLITLNMDGVAHAFNGRYDNFKVEIVPEPTTIALVAAGLIMARARRRR
jgi:hypothetical protein